MTNKRVLITAKSKEDVDLTAMLEDLTAFEDNLSGAHEGWFGLCLM